MSDAQIREPASFGKRREPHTIVVLKGDKSKVFNINPVYISLVMCFGFLVTIGYFGATAYLIFRDDLIQSSFSRQARIQHEYEDRIAALRAKLDRVTSRQLLDQRQIEARVAELMERQENIGSRSRRMGNLVNKANLRGLGVVSRSGAIPVPVSNPQKQAKSKDTITTGSIRQPDFANLFAMRGTHSPGQETTPVGISKPRSSYAYASLKAPVSSTRHLFSNVANAITVIDASQREEVDSLRLAAANKAQKITDILKGVGARVPQATQSDVGGPFVPLDHSVSFDVHLDALETTLNRYDKVASLAKALPLKNPLPGAAISSRYGTRIDPFNGRTAMHGGIDFKAPRGSVVRASGSGVVVSAGRNGGYGKVVEVKHRDGLVTRYAHLSRISVKEGQRVDAGQIVGKVGSTGRSTGPHLHYEVRSGGKTRNPETYINTGYKLRGLL